MDRRRLSDRYVNGWRVATRRAAEAPMSTSNERRWRAVAVAIAMILSVSGVAMRPATAAFPGENGLIAFASDRDGNNEIYIMDADGTDQARLTTNAASDSDPSWSPDGTRIAFISSRDHFTAEIYVMDADGSDPTRLTTNTATDFQPSWSPDGTRIAFTSARDGNSEIYVMHADGTNQTRLTTNTANDGDPSWSPDGASIAFASNRDGNSEIYVMDADGSGQTRLTTNTAVDFGPAWSPDGSRIAFSSDRDLNPEIYVMDADGTSQTRLTTHTAFDAEPTWSPDGSSIAFTSQRDANFEIYAMNVDGSDQTRLTTNAALESTPDWQSVSPDAGTVAADVTIPTSAACLELSVTAISFGTLLLGAENEPATPTVTVTNCSGSSGTLFASGTDATGTGSQWSLVDSSATCADTLGLDTYRLSLASTDLAGPVSLATTNKTVQTLTAGQSTTHSAHIFTACPGSTGAGQTMSMAINFLATD